MKKVYCLLILSLFLIGSYSGCSNPIGNEQTINSTTQVFSTAVLDFYVWKRVPAGTNAAVPNAYVDIYQGTKLIKTFGVTNSEGQIFLPVDSLNKGSYKAIAYTLVGIYPDYYGFSDFQFLGESLTVRIEVFHS